MPLLIAAFVAAASIGFFATHFVRGWATNAGLVDEPDGVRRVHPNPVPRLGGVGIFASVATIGFVLGIRALILEQVPSTDVVPLVAVLSGAAAVFALGVLDDIRGLQPQTKFVFEVVVAVMVFAAGVRIGGFGLPSGTHYELPYLADLAITVFWLVGITNAFNLVDGSDGVAGGAAIFAASAVALVSILNGNDFAAVFALVLAGATLGFLFFNFPPASIFLGDGGALFLGFTLASLGLLSAQRATTAVAIAIPIVSFGLPILDTLLAVGRRFLRGERLFNGDRGHIHHRLRDLGHSPRKVALLLWAACGAFALLSLVFVQPNQTSVTVALVVAGAVVWLSIQRLHIPELLEVQRIVDRGFHQRVVIANNVRIREAAKLIEQSHTPEEVVEALAHAFASNEFERAEIWLSGDAALRFEDCAVLEPDGPGYVWRLHFEETDDPAGHDGARDWEVRFQLKNGEGESLGRLSLWPGRQNQHLLIDLKLVSAELLPAFEHMLDRLEAADQPRAAADPPPRHAQAPTVRPGAARRAETIPRD